MASGDKEAIVQAAAAAVLARLRSGGCRACEAPVGVSGRHVHLSAGDLGTLFGRGAVLTEARPLRQTGQFAAHEVVTVVGPTSSRHNVRVVGPTRAKTVVELPASDLGRLGLDPDVGANEPFDVVLSGPAGVIRLPGGGVVARRHLHATPADAERYGFAEGDTVTARLGKPGRRVVFEDVRVRVAEAAALEFHLDRDEAYACGARIGDVAEILRTASPRRAGTTPAGRSRRHLVTEADVLEAHARGTAPPVRGVILTPYAKEALRKHFPELRGEIG